MASLVFRIATLIENRKEGLEMEDKFLVVVACCASALIGWAVVSDIAQHEPPKKYRAPDFNQVVYRSSTPPTAEEMRWVVQRWASDRDFNSPSTILYTGIESACYRNGKIEVIMASRDGAKTQKYFAEVPAKYTQVILNVDGVGMGWLIYYKAQYAQPSLVGLPDAEEYGIVLHVRKGVPLETCK